MADWGSSVMSSTSNGAMRNRCDRQSVCCVLLTCDCVGSRDPSFSRGLPPGGLPSTEELKQLFGTPAFQARVIKYLSAVVWQEEPELQKANFAVHGLQSAWLIPWSCYQGCKSVQTATRRFA